MEYNHYLFGELSIPKDRLDETNELVLTILDKGGIRKTRQIELGNRIITVLDIPSIDSLGRIYFDYSIFEKKQKKPAYYDTETGELYTEMSGYSPYEIIMDLVRTIQEAYSEEPCFLMGNKKICSVYGTAILIKEITGKKLEFCHRQRTWTWEDIEKYGDKIELYKVFGRENEDEFLGIWKHEDMKFSDELLQNIEQWKSDYRKKNEGNECDIEKMMGEILYYMYEGWQCRYVSSVFVTTFLKNKNDVRFQKVLSVLKQIVEKDSRHFPELTKNQVMRWITPVIHDTNIGRQINCLVAILSNQKLRNKTFGF